MFWKQETLNSAPRCLKRFEPEAGPTTTTCSPVPQSRPAHAPLWATSLTAASPAASLARRAARCGARPCLTIWPPATDRAPCSQAGLKPAVNLAGRPAPSVKPYGADAQLDDAQVANPHQPSSPVHASGV